MALLAYALTTVDRAKSFIGASSYTAEDDTFLESIINIITGSIQAYTGRHFQKTAYTNEVHDGVIGDTLVLDHYPIISTETFLLEERDDDSWDEVDSDDYLVYPEDGMVSLEYDEKFGRVRRSWRASYTAGYDFDNVATFLSDTSAGDLELVAWTMVSDMWNRRRDGRDVSSEKIGDYAIKYADSSRSYFKDGSGNEVSFIQSTLDKYRRLESEAPLTPKIY